jgi:signal transduction protein with GAF and PtsI domain
MPDTKENAYCRHLYQLAATLNSPRSSNDVINSIVEGVAKAMEAKGCALMLLTPDEKVLLHTAAYGLSDWFVRKGPVLVDESMAQTLAGNPLVVLDATADDKVQFHRQLKHEGIASVLSVPVTLRDKVIGVMRVYTSVTRQFDEADVNFAKMAASFGAMALETAQFYHTMEKDYASFTEDLLQWRAELGDEWMMEPSVTPLKELAFKIPPGG